MLIALCAGSAVVASPVPELSERPQGTPDVPATVPDSFAVMPFENRSGVRGLDWMSATIPFLLAEKVERHAALRPAYGPLVLPESVQPQPVSAEAVSAFAIEVGARWVWTGWVERPDWELRLGVALWRVNEGAAARVGEVVDRKNFGDVHAMTGEAIAALLGRVGLALDAEAVEAVKAAPSRDFYALTLFGRGLTALVGTGGAVDAGRAEKDLSRAVFIDPKLAEAQRVLGELHRRGGNQARARGRIAQALELRPDYYAAITAQAEIDRDRGRSGQARELYEDIVRRRPWDLERRYELGEILWAAGDVAGAALELGRVVRANGDHLQARRALVLVHASRGDDAHLVRELEQVVRLAPGEIEARMDLAAAYAAVGRGRDAIAVYGAIVEREPGHLQALKFLGDLHKRAGETREAIAYYNRALDADPADPRPYFLLGAAYVEAGDDRAAKQIYRRAQRFREYLGEVYNNLGAIAYREGKLNESLWYTKRAVERRPDNARFRYNYALTLSASGQSAEALTQVDAGLGLDGRHADLHYLRGVVMLRLGEAGKAQESFERVLALEPRHPDARHNLRLLEEMGRRAKEGEIVIEGSPQAR